jgi:DNA primase
MAMKNYEEIISACKELLNSFPPALPIKSYLQERIPPSTIDKFDFGYFPSKQYSNVLNSIVGENNIQLHDHNLIMPYRDVYGNIVAIVGRTILTDKERNLINIPKYKNTEFKKRNHLFGLNISKDFIIKNNLAFIVEGQFDCISAFEKGLNNIVAIGSANLTQEQFFLLFRYTNNIVLMLDDDEAGRKGEEKIIKTYSKYANIRRAKLPKGYKDIDEFLKDNDMESLQMILK